MNNNEPIIVGDLNITQTINDVLTLHLIKFNCDEDFKYKNVKIVRDDNHDSDAISYFKVNICMMVFNGEFNYEFSLLNNHRIKDNLYANLNHITTKLTETIKSLSNQFKLATLYVTSLINNNEIYTKGTSRLIGLDYDKLDTKLQLNIYYSDGLTYVITPKVDDKKVTILIQKLNQVTQISSEVNDLSYVLTEDLFSIIHNFIENVELKM